MDSMGIDGDGGGVSAIEKELFHVVELVASTKASDSTSEDQITPLLTQADKPKLSIFTVSYPRRKNNKLLHRKYSGNFLVNLLGKCKESDYSGQSVSVGGLAYYITAP